MGGRVALKSACGCELAGRREWFLASLGKLGNLYGIIEEHSAATLGVSHLSDILREPVQTIDSY